MFKTIISFFVFLSCASSAFSLSTPSWANIHCSPRLKECLSAIQKLPEAQKLISRIQKEGPIQIATNDSPLSRQFGAFWDSGRRTIYINPSAHETEGEIIGSIIFELHNADMTMRFDEIDYLAATGKIDKNNYVRSMEFVEYENSKKAAAIAEKGVQLGLFPKTARLPTYRNFEEHFYFQKVGGHSACFERIYNRIAPKTCYR